MNEEKYQFSTQDVEHAIEGINESTLNLGSDTLEHFIGKVVSEMERYANVGRFFRRNCVGCVSGNNECDFVYGRGVARGCWDKARKGELFDCPVRTNGTCLFSPEKGKVESIDISDRDQEPYPTIEVTN